MAKVTTVCPYCGCGCKLQLDFKNDQVKPADFEYAPCVKGLKVLESYETNRLDKVLIREDKNAPFNEVSWDYAYRFILKNLKKIDPSKVYFTSSGEFTNESNYMIHKFARAYGTINVDSCARLCHAATGIVWKQAFGLKGISGTYKDIQESDLFIYFGSNPLSNYPNLGSKLLRLKSQGAKLITFDVYKSKTASIADIFVQISPNKINQIIVLLLKLILKDNNFYTNAQKIPGFRELSVYLSDYKLAKGFVEKYEKLLKKLVDLIKDSQNIIIGYGMGVTQHVNGVDNVAQITNIANIVGAKLFPGRGKVNVQGADDITQCFIDEDKRQGLNFVDIITALYTPGGIDFLWINGMNPFHSFPDIGRFAKLHKDTFVVVAHHHKNESIKYANVVLPTTMLIEEKGTIIDMVRKVRIVNPIVKYSDNARSPARVFFDVLSIFKNGHISDGFSIDKITQEWITRSPLVLDKAKAIKNLENGIEFYLDKRIKHVKLVTVKDFGYDYNTYPQGYKDEGFNDNTENLAYNYYVTTARSPFHFCSGETTLSSKTLRNLDPKLVAIISKKLASKLNLLDGDKIRITSKTGEIIVPVKIKDVVETHTVILSYHFNKPLTNKITPLLVDPISKTPQFKYIPVNLEKV